MGKARRARGFDPALESLERRRLLSTGAAGAAVDDRPPTAEVEVAVVRQVVKSFFIDVTYRDESGVEVKPADHQLYVSGENDFEYATVVQTDRAADGRSVTIRYEAKKSYGPWAAVDNGVWTLYAQPRAIRDTYGNVLRRVPIGTLRIAVPVRGTVKGTVLLEQWQGAGAEAKPEGVAGVRVFADADRDGRLDPGEPFGLSNEQGAYSIEGIKPGWARVVPETPEGYLHTSDKDGHEVRITRWGSFHRRRDFRIARELDGLHIAAGTSGDDVIEVFKRDGAFRVRVNDEPVERVGDDVIDIRVYGRGGDDRIVIGDGRGALPIVFGGAGDDTLVGSSGPDMLDGGAGADLIDGGDGDDWLVGGSQDDSILGRAGDDVVHGGRGHNVLRGEAGDDTIVADENGQKDTIIGGAGRDEAFADRLPAACDGYLVPVCYDGYRDAVLEIEKLRWRRW